MKNFLIVSSLLLCAIVQGQNVKISGTVKDSLGNVLEMVNIMALKKIDGTMQDYAISNYEGKFSMDLPTGAVYLLNASYLGMKATTMEVDLLENDAVKPLNLILFSDRNQLDDVELVYKMPVVVRGDTIIYNTDSFTNGNERKLGDVLKKLPGMEVDENGGVKVEGKNVSKVMIDGKDFFEGDSKLATQNIPADALSKVEVLKNFNSVDQMRGLRNDEDNIAINIKLKEGKENFWFGDLEGGLGYGENTRYLGNSKLFYYSPRISVNLIGKSNNIGDVPFTFMDYYRFSGGLTNFSEGEGTSFTINDNELGLLVAQNDRVNELQSLFAAANMTNQFSDKISFRAFAIYSDNQTQFIQQSLKNYIQTGTTEVVSDTNDQQNRLGLFKFGGVYKPSHRLQLDYDIFIKNSNQQGNGQTISEFSAENGSVRNSIEEQKQNKPFSFKQNVNAYYTLDANNIFAGYLQYLSQKENPFYNAVLGTQPFSSILPLEEDQDQFNINQNRNIRTHKLNAKIDYYYVINNLSNINFNLGSIYSHQKFNSSIFQVLDNDAVNNLEDPSLTNDVAYDFRDLSIGVKYKLKAGVFTFTPGFTLHNFNIYLKDIKGIREDDTTFILPNFHTNVQFRQSENLQVTYKMIADFTDINNVAEGLLFNNYNQLFQGNRNLKNGIFHNLNLNYSNFSMFNFTSLYANVSYSKRIDAIRNNSFIENINQVNSVINSETTDESLSAIGSFQKKFREFNTNIKSSLSLNRLNLMVNGQYSESRNFTQNYEGSLSSNFKSSLNFEVGYNVTINNYKNGDLESTFLTHRPYANLEYNFLNGFKFETDFNYYNYSSKTGSITNTYSFINSSLYYKKPGSKYELSLNASNLLDVQEISRDGFNENFNITSQYFVQPRILMLRVKYNL